MSSYCFVATDAVSFNSLYREQLEFLCGEGISLTLICGGSHDEIKKLKNRQVGEVINIKMVREPSFIRDLVCLIKLWCHFIFNRYDLVVVTTPKAILLGSLACFFTLQKKRIAFFRGRVYENYEGIKRKVFSFLDLLAILLTHKSLFVSESLKKVYVHDIPLVARKGVVLGQGSGNGVNTSFFTPYEKSSIDKFNIKEKLCISDDKFVVVSIGRICIDKGMHEIAAIANEISKEYPSIHFLMLGRVEDKSFFSLFSGLIEKGVVQHIDNVDDIRPYLAISDIHLFLTHREGFGNVAIEAAAMNVPTLAYDVVGVHDSVVDEVSGLKVRFKDVTAVVKLLKHFAENTDELNQVYSGARKWAKDNFSQDKVWVRYKNFYQSITK